MWLWIYSCFYLSCLIFAKISGAVTSQQQQQPGASTPTLHLSRPSLQIVPVTLSDIGQGIKEVTLVTVKEWLMEPRDTANSDEDTEHISGWSLFFQCRCNGSAKVVLIIMQIELDPRAVSNDNIGL